MKIYKIKVNGKAYRVELESLEEVNAPAPKGEQPNKPAEPSKKPENPVPAGSGEGQAVVSPIQGSVVKVLVNVGDKIKKGQAVAVIEAMKLENEVVSTLDGEVCAVDVSKGSAVASGDPLVHVR